MKKSLLLLLAFLLTTITLGVCTHTPPEKTESPEMNAAESSEKLSIVTTFPPLYSFTTNVAREYAKVTNLVPAGVSVHTWQPKPSDIKKLSTADLLITNGLKLEEFLDDLIAAAANDDLVVVDTSQGVLAVNFAGQESDESVQSQVHTVESEEEHEKQHHEEEDHEHEEKHHHHEESEHEEKFDEDEIRHLRSSYSHSRERKACRDSGGTWLDEFYECENVPADFCMQTLAGIFDHCASACRHDADAEMCIQMCVPVCKVNLAKTHHEEEHRENEGHEKRDEGYQEEDEHETGHHHHHHEGLDPHIWLSPAGAQQQVRNISIALQQVDPKHAAEYENNANLYVQKLTQLEQKAHQKFALAQKQKFIVFHDAYQYFFRAFRLTEYRVAAIKDFPGKEPSPERLQELVELITEHDVGIIFTEPQFFPKTVQILQAEYDIRVFEIDPIGRVISAEGYEKNMQHLVDTFVQAFTEK